MTVKIEISLHPDYGALDKQLTSAMSALGFVRGGSATSIPLPSTDIGNSDTTGFASKRNDETGQSEVAEVPAGAPMRERGQPSPGKARRTKAKIAEDDAADAADQERGERLNEDYKEKTGQNISSGAEDRTDPENPEDAAQDAADEAAEATTAGDDLTVDDVKALAVTYQETYGVAAVQEDGAKIFVEALGTPPDGEKYWKFSILPTDQPSLQKLKSVWQRAIDENPLKRAKV